MLIIQWGCAIATYGEGMTYLLKNANYIMNIKSTSDNLDVYVERVYIHDDNIFSENYPYQIVEYGNYNLLCF